MEAEGRACRRFAQSMYVKLAENQDEKGGRKEWLKLEPRWLLQRLEEEVVELRLAVESFDHGLTDSDTVKRECADVGNFAMMIADRVSTSGASHDATGQGENR